MRSISSSEILSAVRSYSFVVFGDTWPAIRWACSSVPPFDRYAVIPVARNVWQHVDAGSPAAAARRLIIASTARRVKGEAGGIGRTDCRHDTHQRSSTTPTTATAPGPRREGLRDRCALLRDYRHFQEVSFVWTLTLLTSRFDTVSDGTLRSSV